MSIPRTLFAVAALTLALASVGGAQAAKSQKDKPKTAQTTGRLKVTAPDLVSRGRIATSHVFNGMGCNGQNISPALEWSNAPAGTKSFAVTMYDPDAPTGSGWWHWVMYNIPASTTGLVAGAGNNRNAPSGSVQGTTDFGTKGYGGPCPPTGDKPHHYHITVFALKVDKIDVPGNATAAMVGYNLNANKLATARVTGLYGR
ncbi:MAG TPA: YbhB/YbcL family Raf kinase inhibitor-like protein [Gemmatimonadaceae bacterium]|nr:YbhB/YbcL family Raf kinase inhibitor-like protein [Gemmatimonadaceae bacterium]